MARIKYVVNERDEALNPPLPKVEVPQYHLWPKNPEKDRFSRKAIWNKLPKKRNRLLTKLQHIRNRELYEQHLAEKESQKQKAHLQNLMDNEPTLENAQPKRIVPKKRLPDDVPK
eukprot:Awhi_evm1s4026